MAARKALRAVQPDEKPEPLTLAEAAATGDYYKLLLAQRMDIAQSIPDERGPAKAALHRQLSLVAKEIEVLELRLKQEGREGVVTPDEAFNAEAI